ncbi:MAG: hypothetical protein ACE5K4_11225 [Candidatus Hydrothermarchaeota archaeon]
MSKAEIKERAKRAIDRLSEARVRLILDFIDYLNEKEEWEATKEILEDKGMMEDIRACDGDLEKGEMGNFVPWSEVKRG